MGPPPATFVNTYYDDFHANATHLWQDGLPNEINGWAAAGRSDFRFVSWVDKNGRSSDGGQIAGGYSGTPAGRIGYQIGDEPGLGCNDAQCALDSLYEMEAGLNAVRAVDPEALIYINFYMSDYIDELLAYYLDNVDFDLIQYDRYARDKDAYEALEIFRDAGLASHKPYWRYLRAFVYQGNNNTSTPIDMRWDAMAGLVYGYTGHTWFIYTIDNNPDIDPVLFDAENDFNANPTELWHAAAQINLELRNLGRAITQLTSTDVRYIPYNDFLQPKETENWSPGAGDDPYLTAVECTTSQWMEILIGFFKDDAGQIYFMLQNVSHDSGGWPNNIVTTATYRLSFDFNSAPPSTSRTALQTLNKLTGQVESLPLTSSTGDTGYLDVVLEPGDAILLKYDTGAPFALQQ
ncbi:MAG: hypothetical protein DRI34_03390 [Deltaproteobacteria bacterium]|nr:MAG: hypothetical protein DRI34_03390 [Deltaproteobacteria bacterium]